MERIRFGCWEHYDKWAEETVFGGQNENNWIRGPFEWLKHNPKWFVTYWEKPGEIDKVWLLAYSSSSWTDDWIMSEVEYTFYRLGGELKITED